MNILIVTQYFWPENFRVNDLAQGLVERGHAVTVLTGIPNYPGGRLFPGYGYFRRLRENWGGVEVVRSPLIPRGGSGRLRLALNYVSFALCASILGPLRCRSRYDVIFVHEPSPITVGIPALVMKAFKKAPLLFWVLDLWPESISATGAMRPGPALRAVGRLVRFIYRHCDRVLVQSRGFIAKVESMGAPAGKILYFPSWAERLYRPLERDGAAAEMQAMPDGFRVMFAGNIGAAQDFDSILAAAERLRNVSDIHWIILGDGRRFKWVETQVAQRGLSPTVHLLGSRPVETMPRYFALAEAMLVTLRRDPVFALTIPGKIQSYLACGRPIVAMLDGEGARIVEESGAGLACPAENPAALAQAVLTLYRKSRAEREQMGRSALAYYRENFERDRLLDRLERWMRDLPKPA
ncbi:MAG: glycosyltransferase family 4 protein [Betaproteobacteria bacterium]|nr:glycosyltransferase family 4 protein [Betaproteobacteria bacterium]